MHLIAIKQVQGHKRGDDFRVSDAVGNVLIKLGFAKKYEAPPPPKPKSAPAPTYATRAVETDDERDLMSKTKAELESMAQESGVEIESRDTKSTIVNKLSYMRRDMRAED